jgi:hypothetical protein
VGVGIGVGLGVGIGVGIGVGLGVGIGIAVGVGMAVGVGVGGNVGVGVGDDPGIGVGLIATRGGDAGDDADGLPASALASSRTCIDRGASEVKGSAL